MELISANKLSVIASEQKKDAIMLEKDYFLTLFLYFIKDTEGIYFKGGTALHKIFLDYIRLSEDLDFTITARLPEIKRIIEKIIHENKNIFTRLDYDKSVSDFTRYVLHYKSYFQKNSKLILDFNKRAKLYLKPEKHIINNFYGLDFSIHTLNREELIAEKVCALINRNKPRDYFDVYHIIKRGIPINIKLVQEKSKAHNQEFNMIKIFNKTNKVYSTWEKDLAALTPHVMPFQEVMQTLEKYFKYIEEKEKLKKKHR